MDGPTDRYPHITALVQQIEGNLSEEWNTSRLERLGLVSHAQLYRDFYSAVGHSVKEYIRKRRLSVALALVKTSDLSLAQIAHHCGYSSQQAFCRAVRQMVNTTSLRYRQSDLFYFFPPFRGQAVKAVKVSTESIPALLCLEYRSDSPVDLENRAIRALFSILPEYKGRLFGKNEDTMKQGFRYRLFLADPPMEGMEALKAHFETVGKEEAVASLFASATVSYEECGIHAAWEYLSAIWLPKSMFERDDRPYLEEYLLRNGRPEMLKLYLPIKKRRAETVIRLEWRPASFYWIASAKGDHAEEESARRIVHCLHVTKSIRNVESFLVRRSRDACACGVRVKDGIMPPDSERLETRRYAEGMVLALRSDIVGEYEFFRDSLVEFAHENSIRINAEEHHAIYDVRNGFENPSITMLCPVKMR